MRFFSRRWVKPEDLNSHGSLFGGRLLAWIDEEAAIYAVCQLNSKRVVTKFMSEINFVSAARHGDVIEIGLETTSVGRTSITMACQVRNKFTKELIITIEKMVFVHVDLEGNSSPHHKTMEDLG